MAEPGLDGAERIRRLREECALWVRLAEQARAVPTPTMAARVRRLALAWLDAQAGLGLRLLAAIREDDAAAFTAVPADLAAETARLDGLCRAAAEANRALFGPLIFGAAAPFVA